MTDRPPSGPLILVVDDEEANRLALERILVREGYDVRHAEDGRQAMQRLREERPALVLTDLKMPGMDGLELMRAARAVEPELEVVLLTAFGTVETAVEAMKEGAFDFLTKPLKRAEILRTVRKALDKHHLVVENRALREELARAVPGEIIGRSAAMRTLLEEARQVAGAQASVLLSGESGTGKGLLARWIHRVSPRRERPMISVNCGAIPEALLESELFGHERGAFTGAVRAHPGLFEQADGGTLLLDEIGEMPLGLQAKLLRVLEDGRVRRVGGTRDLAVDARVVAATARELESEVAAGRFRSDLFYRLNVVRVRIPPLRERVEDIPLLAEVLIERASRRLGRPVRGLSEEASRLLMAGSWPGNVRQLENALERAVLMASGSLIEAADLPVELRSAGFGPEGGDLEEQDLSIKRHSAALERRLIAAALARTGGNRSQAARLLDLSYKALVYKIRDYGLEEG